jgi:hypothetical protein
VISAASIRDPPIDVYEETGSQTMTVRNQRACSWRCSSRTDGDRENRWTNAVDARAGRPETDPRLVEAAATLRHDPSLLDLLEYARHLDTAERRAVIALMRELAA